ncbi:hypothetical protein ADIWIN_1478 [Winogradskyella psychrotolerans RS-3]|uniref:FUSC family protein n=1 Tax=Winogradskyella psychrotolerans RS-3 TaxID=641526 RepID=S7XBQ9_9FLAO|nr:hypothetical protein [Winogradskyella psychrotolerans]EPR73448.1 hypothetical protein ADIWIN_1478 [Winogradskyella psychrotolerans RS-3]
MKKTVIILGLIAAIIAITLSASRNSNFAIIPIVIAFISGLALVFLSKKDQSKTKPIQYIFLLVIMSLGLTIYKGVYKTIEVESTEQLDQQGERDTDKSKELLENRQIESKF